MLRFKQYLEESKNTHMEHLEDSILNGGVDGAREAINFLRQLRDMLAGDTKSPVNVTVKWDGSPSVIAGIDPSDQQFFVAKKSVFNKNPKVYKTPEEIDADTSGDLNDKMKLALEHLPALGIKGVVQGDFLYSRDDIKEVDIDGEPHITFHPNTIVYAIPKKSRLAKEILRSRIGVVWHTTYRGDSFETMQASFGEEIASDLKQTREVWSVDATYKDVSGMATMTAAETKEVTQILSKAGGLFRKLDRGVLDGISNDPERLMRVKTFVNSKVREGQRIGNTRKFVDDLVKYINDYYGKQEEKRKSEKGKAAQRQRRETVLEYFNRIDKREIVKMFDMYNLLVDAKLIIVKKLDRAKRIDTLLLTANGYEVTGQEGFVAIDHTGKNAIKLVDRLQFSRANFSPDIIKGWDK
jgi:hypothetical protein